MNVQIFESIRSIGRPAWDRLSSAAFPFANYHFLEALETTDCLGRRTGWFPTYLVAEGEGRAAGALIAYLRTNSWGEYVFDFAWAEGARHAGLAYYPKFTSAIPFTPATGPKLLLDPALDAAGRVAATTALLGALKGLVARADASSIHALFLAPESLEIWRAAGYLIRETYQFHWSNRGYADFDAFLADLKSKRRREIQRERAKVATAGLRVHRLTGSALTPARAAEFYAFYESTVDKRAGFAYLTPEFFARIFATFADHTLLVVAEDANGRAVAAALNYFDEDALYGRHWGCRAEYHSLHFECCYYQGIEFAIERGLARFEAGAQGEHKLQRGFLPTITPSAHRVRDPALARAVTQFLEIETAHVRAEVAALAAHSPFAERCASRGDIGYAPTSGES